MEIYLDHTATTRPYPEAIAAVMDAMTVHYANPSSLHHAGLEAQKLVDSARNQLAMALRAKPEELTFTSGATEASNLAIRGTLFAYGKRRRHIVTTTVEHVSVKALCDQLETEGYSVTRVAPDADGHIMPEAVLGAVCEETCLVSMMLVNNETGHILPVAETFAAIKRRYPDVITHCDAVQGFLKLPVQPEKLYADLLTVSGHKVHAPKGVGALYHRKGIRLKPIVYGGHQEGSLRPGTEAVPLIAGFGAAVTALLPSVQERYEAVAALRKGFLERLGKLSDITIQSPQDGSPYILSISVKGLRSETMLHFLAEREIYVSSGSACAKGKSSGVLQAFGVRDAAADSTLRISLSSENTLADADALCDALQTAQVRLARRRIR